MVDQSIPDPQPHLNEDLMRLIIDFIKDDDYIDLGACALTHSSLRSQSQRKLFHSINLFKQPQVEKIIYALSNNKTLGAYTRHLTVIDDENWVLDGSLLVKVLSYMSQLSSLSFEDIWESDFPKLTSETVVPPMSLNTLRFSNCRFESIHVLIRLLTIFYTAYHLELWFQTFQKSSISEQLPDTTPSPELKVTHLHVVGSRPQFKTSDVRVFLSYLEPGSLCFYHTEMTLGKQERSFFEPVCDVSAESLKYLHITTGPWITEILPSFRKLTRLETLEVACGPFADALTWFTDILDSVASPHLHSVVLILSRANQRMFDNADWGKFQRSVERVLGSAGVLDVLISDYQRHGAPVESIRATVACVASGLAELVGRDVVRIK